LKHVEEDGEQQADARQRDKDPYERLDSVVDGRELR
jgi:hypothetical protein